MSEERRAELLLEVEELLASLNEVKVQGLPLGLHRRSDIMTKLAEVELTLKWSSERSGESTH